MKKVKDKILFRVEVEGPGQSSNLSQPLPRPRLLPKSSSKAIEGRSEPARHHTSLLIALSTLTTIFQRFHSLHGSDMSAPALSLSDRCDGEALSRDVRSIATAPRAVSTPITSCARTSTGRGSRDPRSLIFRFPHLPHLYVIRMQYVQHSML